MTAWQTRWHSIVRRTKVPCIWERRDGGFLIRTYVTDATTGRRCALKKVLPAADLATAVRFLENERARLQAGGVRPTTSRMRFAAFAASLFEAKVASRDIISEAGRRKWASVLPHLVEGTRDCNGRLLVRGFGEMWLDELRPQHVEAWRTAVTARLLTPKVYAPTTANGWLAVLKVITRAAKRQLDLAEDAARDTPRFDTSEHHPYTEEEPNSLTADEVRRFLAAMRTMYPQHYAMTLLGLVTGLRPSSMRPLRRSGETPDVLWSEGVLLVRRSQTRGERVMGTTKTKRHQRINLPEDVMDILRWHVETQLTTPEQQASELLFPALNGGFRAPCVLNKPFASVAAEAGFSKRFTQRGLRRTYQDLARAAGVSSLVTRSISGHATETMQHHYSTVKADEQRTAVASIVRVVAAAKSLPSHVA